MSTNGPNSTALPAELRGPLFLERTWLWLCFSIYYFVPFFYRPLSWQFHGVLLLAYGLFVALFLIAARHVGNPQGLSFKSALAGLIVMGFLIYPLSPGSSTFFTYSCFLMGFVLPLSRFVLALGLLILSVIVFNHLLSGSQSYFLFPTLAGILTIGAWGYLEQLRFRMQLQVLKSNEEIKSLAAIAERERIARDLHDLLGHTLSSIAVTAELAEKLLERQRDAEALVHIKALHQVARDGLGLVRQTVSGYKHRGLQGEILRLCDTLRTHGFSVIVEGRIPELDARAETIAILTLTELTTNVLRHSRGSQCVLSFFNIDNRIEITFADNGQVNTLQPGNGLRGIQERLQSIGAQLQIDTTPATRFHFALPGITNALHQEAAEPS